MSLSKRIDALWARTTPLERARALAARGIHPRLWSRDELESFCAAECQSMKLLSDAELEILARSDT